MALFAVTFVLAWALLYAREERMEVPAQTKVLLLVVTVILYTVFGKVYEAFLLDVERIHHMVYSQMLAAVILTISRSELPVCIVYPAKSTYPSSMADMSGISSSRHPINERRKASSMMFRI